MRMSVSNLLVRRVCVERQCGAAPRASDLCPLVNVSEQPAFEFEHFPVGLLRSAFDLNFE